MTNLYLPDDTDPPRSVTLSNVITILSAVAKDSRTCTQDREALARAAKAIATVGGRFTKEEIQGDMFSPPEEITRAAQAMADEVDQAVLDEFRRNAIVSSKGSQA